MGGGAACVAWGLLLLLLQMLSEKNVRFFMSDSVTEVRGVDGKVTDPNMLSHNKNTVLPVSLFFCPQGEGGCA